MKELKSWIAAVVLFISGTVYAQDLIITRENDSIYCHITKIEDGFISFSYLKDGKREKTGINESDITSYRFAYFNERENKEQQERVYPLRWRFALRGGYSRLLASTGDVPEPLKDYANGFKNGYHLGAEIDYFFTKHIGLGGKFAFYNNKTETNLSVIGAKGKMSDNANSYYIAPTFVARFPDKTNLNTFFCDASIGLFCYRDKAVASSSSYESATGRTNCVGFQIGAGYERALTKNLSIGGGLSFLIASTGKMDYTINGKKLTVELEERENLSRLDLSLYLTFYAGGQTHR